MEVEVKQEGGFYLKALVIDVSENHLVVRYGSGFEESVAYEKCRAIVRDTTATLNKHNLKAGDIVDAYVRIGGSEDGAKLKNNDNNGTNTVDYNKKLKKDGEELFGYRKMRITAIKGDFVVLESVTEREEESCTVNNIVALEQCRHHAIASTITPDSVKSCTINIPPELFNYFSSGQDPFKMLQESVPKILIKPDLAGRKIVIKSFSDAAIKKVHVLQESFMNHCKQKSALIHRQEESKKLLSSIQPSRPIPEESELVEEFEVPSSLMGFVIGAKGTNISNARKLKGVKKILVDESEAQRTHGTCKITIYAETAEAIEQARDMLEFMKKQVKVPNNVVGRIIGKMGKTMQDIVDKSGVLKVHIGDEEPERDYIDFTFIGSREAISIAELMVEFNLKHIKEIDDIQMEEATIKRKLYSLPYANRQQPRTMMTNGSGGSGAEGGGGRGGGGTVGRPIAAGGGGGFGNFRQPQRNGPPPQQQQQRAGSGAGVATNRGPGRRNYGNSSGGGWRPHNNASNNNNHRQQQQQDNSQQQHQRYVTNKPQPDNSTKSADEEQECNSNSE